MRGKPRWGNSEELVEHKRHPGISQEDEMRWRGERGEGSDGGSEHLGDKVICSLKAFTLEANC